MDVNIICSLIEASGAIIAAVSAALIAKEIVKKDIKPIFQAYSDSTHDLAKVIETATHNIVIFTAAGDKLLEKYRYTIEERIKCGVSVYYLLLNEQRLLEMERYMHLNDTKDENIYSFVKGQLKELNRDYPGKIQSREFPYFMTASYIGVDIPFGEEQDSHFPDSVIQVMQYQYGRKAKDSPISYLSLKRDKNHFEGTLHSMNEMWNDAEKFPEPEDTSGQN